MTQTLRQLCLKSKRLNEIDINAFKKEIGAIEIHGLENYFLTILSKDIKVGNDCNSVVAYLIGITDNKPIDTLMYKGGTIPDIDMDFEKERRDEVLDYIRSRYGNNNVAQIGSFNKIYAKSAIRFVGKSLGYEVGFVDKVAKLVPDMVQGVNWSIEDAIESSKELKELRDTDRDVAKLLKSATKLEGIISAKSKHPAGVIISNEPINDLISTWRDKDDSIVLEFDMHEAEDMGYVKVDLLGIKTLSVVKKTIELIKEHKNIDIIFETIPIDTPEIFNLLSTGDLLGVFQLEGRGISDYTKDFKPSSFMDISLISAGYRPGPIDFMPEISKIKHNRDLGSITIQPHSKRFPILKDILKETYGYFIYQEQIQKVVELIAGYNDSEADEFRKIVAKKIREKLVKEKEKFVPKAIAKGLTEKEVEELWSEMETFGAYAFNKSHSVAYSILTARTAWLKANYPVEFFTANIIFERNDINTMMQFILEAQKFGIKMLPPDINTSSYDFTVVNNNTIMFGLNGITSVGSSSDLFIEERKSGKFKTLTDFILRTSPRSNVLKNMIKAGCFDSIVNRSQVFHQNNEVEYLDELLDFIKYIKGKNYILPNGNTELIPLPIIPEYPIEDCIAMEAEVTSLWLSDHPFKIYKDNIQKYKTQYPKSKVGFVVEYKKFKNGNGLMFTLQEENNNQVTYFIFKKQWERIGSEQSFKDKYSSGIVGVNSYRALDNDPTKLIVEDIEQLSSKKRNIPYGRRVFLPIDNNIEKNIATIKNIRFENNDYLSVNLVGKNFRSKIPIRN